MTFCQIKTHTSAVFSPMGFFLLFCLVFCMAALVPPCKWMGRGASSELRMNLWQFSTTRSIFVLLMGLWCFWGCAQALRYFLYFPTGSLWVLPSASNDDVLAKPFVFHCQAEPSSPLHPAVSLSLSDQPQLIPLDFSEPQLYWDIKPVENRSISSFLS